MKKISLLTFVAVAVGAITYFMLQEKQNSTSNEMDYGNSSSKFRYAQDKDLSPYAMFGDSSVVLLTDAERYGKQFIEIFNTDKLSEIYKIEFDQKQQKIRFYNKKKEQIKEELLDPEMIARFLSVDPRADKYYGWSPYNYVLGNPIRNIDPRGDTVRIMGADGNAMNWMPGMDYTGNDQFIGQTVGALNLLYQYRENGDMPESVFGVGGNIFDFAADADKHVTIHNYWNEDGTKNVPGFGGLAMDWTNPSGTDIWFDAYSGINVGDISPDKAKNPLNSHHTPGTLSPSILLAHEMGHAWITQYAPQKKASWSSTAEHLYIYKNVEGKFGMAIHGAARMFRTPENGANPSLKYYDHIITTSGATSNVPVLNRYNH